MEDKREGGRNRAQEGQGSRKKQRGEKGLLVLMKRFKGGNFYNWESPIICCMLVAELDKLDSVCVLQFCMSCISSLVRF